MNISSQMGLGAIPDPISSELTDFSAFIPRLAIRLN